MLQCGNLRAVAKATNTGGRQVHLTPRNTGADEDARDPLAVVFMSFDPHTGEGPVLQQIFDTHPADVATILTSGRALGQDGFVGTDDVDKLWEGYVHLADFCLIERTARFLLVLAQAPAGAGEPEVSTIRENVFGDIMMLLKSSKLIRAGVADGQLQVEGAIYHGAANTSLGPVEWLGAHPSQGEVLHKILQANASSQLLPTMDMLVEQAPPGLVESVLKQLQAGNQRFLADGQSPHARWRPEKLAKLAESSASPLALVLAGANGDVRAPEYLFDSGPGELLIHRTCGAISGRRGGCAISFLESMVRQHPDTCVLLIVGDVRDPAVSAATTQVQHLTSMMRPTNAQSCIEQLAPAVIHSLRAGAVTAEEQNRLVATVAQMHVFYVMERLLIDTDVVFERVRTGRLEVQGAVAQMDGSVTFIGGHYDVQRVIDQRARIGRHRKKGLRLGGPVVGSAR